MTPTHSCAANSSDYVASGKARQHVADRHRSPTKSAKAAAVT